MKLTRNRHGWISPRPNELSELFISHAAHATAPVLDIGAGDGVTALAALGRGAHVIASDLEPEHLARLSSQAGSHGRRLELLVGRFPEETNLPPGSIALAHASLVLHFLRPQQLCDGFVKLADWLQPGGRMYAIASSPYVGNFRNYLSRYESLSSAGHPWPGFIDKVADWTDADTIEALPPELLLLDLAGLRRAVESSGLQVDDLWYFRRRDLAERFQGDGRENIGLLASRPITGRPMSLSAFGGEDQLVKTRVAALRKRVWTSSAMSRGEHGHDPGDDSALHWALVDSAEVRAAARMHIVTKQALDQFAMLYPTIASSLHSLEQPFAFFSRLVVDPSFRGLGVGRRLDWVRAQRAATLGARTIALIASGSRAKHLRERGFAVRGVVPADQRHDGLCLAGELLVGPVSAFDAP